MKIIAKLNDVESITITAHKKTTRAKLYRKYIVYAMLCGYHDRRIKNAVIKFE